MPIISRRSTLDLMGAALATSFLGGCCLFPEPNVDFCPDDPRYTDPNTPLTIDGHAHVFNGTDLQVKGFLNLCILKANPQLAALGPILQELGWDLAPGADAELAALDELGPATGQCPSDHVTKTYTKHSEAAYLTGVKALRDALSRVKARRAGVAPLVESKIDALPDTYAVYKSQRALDIKARSGYSIDGALAFILRNFQYRYVNVFDYLMTYSTGKTRKIDLIVAHLVDYDWPIGMGEETRTTFDQQLVIMEKMAVVTGGLVHAFVPFDPMKEVAYRRGLNAKSSLDLVIKAVMQCGFIGVKLYPPMGFAPYGNAQIAPGFWSYPWLRPELNYPEFGNDLDKALNSLYEFCAANHVPIMAHTAQSCAPSNSAAYYTNFLQPSSWNKIPPGLHIDFGHFGDTDEGTNGINRAKAFVDLMTSAPGSQGEHFFADTGFFDDILSDADILHADLQQLYQYSAGKRDAALAQRLMYGTDWEMVIAEGQEVNQYLQRFETLYASLDAAGSLGAYGRLSDRFFGINAANFLDARSTDPKSNRARLTAFYAANNMPKPNWLTKVDNLPPDPAGGS